MMDLLESCRALQLLHPRENGLQRARKSRLLRAPQACEIIVNEIGSSFQFSLQPGGSGGSQLVENVSAVLRILRPRRKTFLHEPVQHDAQSRGRKPVMRGQGLEIPLPVESKSEKCPKPLLAHPLFSGRRELLPHVPLHGPQDLKEPPRKLAVG